MNPLREFISFELYHAVEVTAGAEGITAEEYVERAVKRSLVSPKGRGGSLRCNCGSGYATNTWTDNAEMNATQFIHDHIRCEHVIIRATGRARTITLEDKP